MIPTGFTGATIDRADQLRHDDAGLAAAMADPAARCLTLHGLDPAVDAQGQLVWDRVPAGREVILLGLDAAGPRFVAAPLPGERPAGTRSPALFQMLTAMPRAEAALYAAARSVVDWHARHGFCSVCGSATALFRAGWGRTCPNCAAQHFPRVDPVVIMIAQHQGRALLGRQPQFPAGRYSALAGFVEPGESIEEAVARELAEEAGIRVSNVRYIASQPWPFPSSLMIACVADAEDDRITLDVHELEDAIWATRKEVRHALTGAEDARFGAPPPYAIAHTLLREWARG